MYCQRKRLGFTLTEMLVVVAIVSLIAAILFPVFLTVRENGRRASCLSNMRQIGTAVMQYTSDYDDRHHSGTYNIGEGWAHDAAYPYLKIAAVFQCPDDSTQNLVRATAGFEDLKPATPNSYGLNENLGSQILAELGAPAQTVMLFEVSGCQETFAESYRYGNGSDVGNGTDKLSHSSAVGDSTADTEPGQPLYATGNMGGRTVNGSLESLPRHRGGSNYTACDGHVKWSPASRISCGNSQPSGGANCGQDSVSANCGGLNTAAGTANNQYTLTFSLR